MTMRGLGAVLGATLVAMAVASTPAVARVEWDLSGRLQADMRLRLTRETAGGWYDQRELTPGVARNENIAKLRLLAESGPFLGVAEMDFVWIGILRDVETFDDLSRRERVDPFRLEAHALYVEATDLFVAGLDLRIGQQRITWGKGDQFNPTNTLNPNDLEDPLLFGDQVANAMLRVDYSPRSTVTLSAVVVPVFKPAVLPRSGVLGLARLDRLPFVEDQLRQRVLAEQGLLGDLGYPTVLSQAHTELPEVSLDNMQAAARVAATLAGHDIALSYYVGRSDIPQPYLNVSALDDGRRCNPTDPDDCVEGLVRTDVMLGYRRMQVLGINVAGQLDLLQRIWSRIQPLGYWLELGVVFPQPASIALLQRSMDFGFFQQPAGEYDYDLGGRRPEVVSGKPFAKWVLGFDYSFGSRVYANLQWVHGLVDEFGAGDFFSAGWSARSGSAEGNSAQLIGCALGAAPRGASCAVELLRPRLGDYLVLGTDVRLLQDALLARLFVILDLSGVTEERWSEGQQRRVRTHHSLFSAQGFSAVIFPQLSYNFGDGFELGGGALIKLGREHTKFGDPAAGGTEVWVRSRFAF